MSRGAAREKLVEHERLARVDVSKFIRVLIHMTIYVNVIWHPLRAFDGERQWWTRRGAHARGNDQSFARRRPVAFALAFGSLRAILKQQFISHSSFECR